MACGTRAKINTRHELMFEIKLKIKQQQHQTNAIIVHENGMSECDKKGKKSWRCYLK